MLGRLVLPAGGPVRLKDRKPLAGSSGGGSEFLLRRRGTDQTLHASRGSQEFNLTGHRSTSR